jgi:hypothetical protein
VGARWGKPFLHVFIVEINLLKTFFSRTSRPISIKLDTIHLHKGNSSLYKMGQVLFKEEIIAKMGWDHLDIFFSRTTGPKSSDLRKAS